MPEVHVVALIPAKPDAVDDVRGALTALVNGSRTEEGCVSYALSTSASDPTTFVTVEVWRSQEDLDAHFTSPHIATAMQAADGRLAGEITIHTLVPVV